MLNPKLSDFEKSAQETDNFLTHELSSLRAGRANAGVLEEIKVEAYGVRVPLMQLASISVPEPRQMLVTPFDPQTVKDIERALQAADLGLSIVAEGKALRLTVPPLTEERRLQIVKTLKQKLEAARVRLRQARDEQREKIIAQERDGSVGEDEKFNLLKDLDERTKHWQEQLEARGKKKEEEVMTV